MNLTYYPFKPFSISDGKITVIDTGDTSFYRNLLNGIRDLDDELHISDDNFQSLVFNKSIAWYGDLLLDIDLNQLFMRKVRSRLEKLLSAEQQVAITDLAKQLQNLLPESSFSLDLPIESDAQLDLDKITKFVDLNFDPELKKQPYAILETLCKTVVEINDQRVIALTNVSHYLTTDEFFKFEQLVSDLNLTLLLIEFSSETRQSEFDKAQYYYVDSNFVDDREW